MKNCSPKILKTTLGEMRNVDVPDLAICMHDRLKEPK